MSNKNLFFDRMESMESYLGIEFVSYGLAPNPSGYCYEIVDQDHFENTVSNDREMQVALQDVCNNAPRGFLKQQQPGPCAP